MKKIPVAFPFIDAQIYCTLLLRQGRDRLYAVVQHIHKYSTKIKVCDSATPGSSSQIQILMDHHTSSFSFFTIAIILYSSIFVRACTHNKQKHPQNQFPDSGMHKVQFHTAR